MCNSSLATPTTLQTRTFQNLLTLFHFLLAGKIKNLYASYDLIRATYFIMI